MGTVPTDNLCSLPVDNQVPSLKSIGGNIKDLNEYETEVLTLTSENIDSVNFESMTPEEYRMTFNSVVIKQTETHEEYMVKCLETTKQDDVNLFLYLSAYPKDAVTGANVPSNPFDKTLFSVPTTEWLKNYGKTAVFRTYDNSNTTGTGNNVFNDNLPLYFSFSTEFIEPLAHNENDDFQTTFGLVFGYEISKSEYLLGRETESESYAEYNGKYIKIISADSDVEECVSNIFTDKDGIINDNNLKDSKYYLVSPNQVYTMAFMGTQNADGKYYGIEWLNKKLFEEEYASTGRSFYIGINMFLKNTEGNDPDKEINYDTIWKSIDINKQRLLPLD